jgi:hypothetical protein
LISGSDILDSGVPLNEIRLSAPLGENFKQCRYRFADTVLIGRSVGIVRIEFCVFLRKYCGCQVQYELQHFAGLAFC